MILTADHIVEAETQRLRGLARQSELDNVVLVEMVYAGRFIRFDLTEMQARHLTPTQLFDRCVRQPLKDLGLAPLAESSALSSSSTNV